MENLALTTLLLPLSAHWSFRFRHNVGPPNGVLFAALTTLCMLSLISAFYQADKVAVTLTLVNVGDVALFGTVIDRVEYADSVCGGVSRFAGHDLLHGLSDG